MWRTTLRTLWLGLHLLLLVMLMLGYVLPVVDPRATELDPWHEHIVLGGTPAQRAAALSAHVHGLDDGHAHPSTGSPLSAAEVGVARVLSMAAHDGFTPLSFGIIGKIVVVPSWLSLTALAFCGDVELSHHPLLTEFNPSVPVPPPRLFSLVV